MIKKLFLGISFFILIGCASFYTSDRSRSIENIKKPEKLVLKIDGQYPDGKLYTQDDLDKESKKYITHTERDEIRRLRDSE